MLVHEFIAVTEADVLNEIVYDLVKKQHCIKICDDIILNYLELLRMQRTQWDEVGNFREGLNYHGITIISPNDIPDFIDILQELKGYRGIMELIELCHNALSNKSYIVHFGV